VQNNVDDGEGPAGKCDVAASARSSPSGDSFAGGRQQVDMVDKLSALLHADRLSVASVHSPPADYVALPTVSAAAML